MERWAGKVAVVTGASSGIGLATAKALLENGMIVIGLSRRVEKMQNEMKKINGSEKFFTKACNVSKENDVIQAFSWIEKKFQSVHILVNNAGVMKEATLQEMKTEDIENIFNVNVIGLLHCTREALKLMKKNKHEAHIININSNSGHKVPNFGIALNVYPATKHAVTALCESLIIELKGEKIRVTSISPGIVKTDIFSVAQVNLSFVDKLPALDPEDVANSIIHVISSPPHVQITELTIKPLGQVH